jgi:hypothetical protein
LLWCHRLLWCNGSLKSKYVCSACFNYCYGANIYDLRNTRMASWRFLFTTIPMPRSNT